MACSHVRNIARFLHTSTPQPHRRPPGALPALPYQLARPNRRGLAPVAPGSPPALRHRRPPSTCAEHRPLLVLFFLRVVSVSGYPLAGVLRGERPPFPAPRRP